MQLVICNSACSTLLIACDVSFHGAVLTCRAIVLITSSWTTRKTGNTLYLHLLWKRVSFGDQHEQLSGVCHQAPSTHAVVVFARG